MKFILTFFAALIFIVFAFIGCKNDVSSTPSKITKKQDVKEIEVKSEMPQTEITIQEISNQEGYIYKQRDRRDPFMSLIVPKQKLREKDIIKAGTLEGYDIGEFHLAAIAKKGTQYFALIVTPDNRSFSVSRGTTIGLNEGKVEEISSDKIVLVEYSRDYKGELKPRRITLEFFKGE